ncbi:MAG: hypothetical protein HXY41_06870 [Chloroflexi bacterium]|nr:hypothetical protein [Chloroflexota bacterium]
MPRARWTRLAEWLPVVVGLLAGCGPEPTPFPVDIPAEETRPPEVAEPAPAASVLPSPAALAFIRYALAANTGGLVADLPLIETSAPVEYLTTPPLPDDLGRRYDILAAFGDLPGGARSPVLQHVALFINPAAVQQEELAAILRHSLDPADAAAALAIPGLEAEPLAIPSATQRRVELANAGWPDGLDLTLAYTFAPGAAQAAALLCAAGIRVNVTQKTPETLNSALETGQVHLALIVWTTPDERAAWAARAGAANLVDLYAVPIGYQAVPGLNITFTPSGWPIANR